MAASPNITLYSIAEPIPQGYFLGRLSAGTGKVELIDIPTMKAYLFQEATASGVPADTDTAVQYNASGAFGGDHSHFAYDYTNAVLTITTKGTSSVSGQPGLIVVGGDNNQHGAAKFFNATPINNHGYVGVGYDDPGDHGYLLATNDGSTAKPLIVQGTGGQVGIGASLTTDGQVYVKNLSGASHYIVHYINHVTDDVGGFYEDASQNLELRVGVDGNPTGGDSLLLATGGSVFGRTATGGQKGAGTINVSGGYYVNGVALTSGGSPGGSTNAIQYNNAGAFAGVGPLTNGQLVIGSTSAAPVAATLTAGSNVTITNGAGTITIAASAGGGGGVGGLFSGVLSTLPTSSGTGLSNWFNQGSATVADSSAGLSITLPAGSGQNVVGRYKTAPSTPYTITALVAVTSLGGDGTNNIGVGVGWKDSGTNTHTVQIVLVGNGLPVMQVQKRASGTASATTDFSSQRLWTHPCWLQISDDGTNAVFRYSADGANFVQLFSVAKASGFLGSSGYANVGFFVGGEANNDGANKIGSLMSWD